MSAYHWVQPFPCSFNATCAASTSLTSLSLSLGFLWLFYFCLGFLLCTLSYFEKLNIIYKVCINYISLYGGNHLQREGKMKKSRGKWTPAATLPVSELLLSTALQLENVLNGMLGSRPSPFIRLSSLEDKTLGILVWELRSRSGGKDLSQTLSFPFPFFSLFSFFHGVLCRPCQPQTPYAVGDSPQQHLPASTS